jgi:hypothetical protein
MQSNGRSTKAFRKYSRSNRFRKARPSVRDVAPSFRIAKYRVNKPEMHYLDLTNDIHAISFDPTQTQVGGQFAAPSTRQCFHLNTIDQGPSVNNRIGNHFTMRQLRLNYLLSAGAFAGVGTVMPTVVRVLVFEHKYSNCLQTTGDGSYAGYAANVSSLIKQVVNTAAFDENSINKMVQPEKIQSFNILYDVYHSIPSKPQFGGAMPHSVLIPLFSQGSYTGAAAAVGQNYPILMTRGALYLVFISNTNTVADMPIVHWDSRLTFTDN